MPDPKDINDSLDFLRWFDHYTDYVDLGARVKEQLEKDRTFLDLKNVRLVPEEFKALANMEPLIHLRYLCLNQTGLDNESLSYLCTSQWFSRLEAFHIGNNNIWSVLKGHTFSLSPIGGFNDVVLFLDHIGYIILQIRIILYH